jgi:N-methylhydantoinase B
MHDGQNCCFPANLSNAPIEVLESLIPVVFTAKELITDSAGAGRHRGGWGQRLAFEVHGPMLYLLMASRRKYAPQGLLGGGPGRAGRAYLNGHPIWIGDRQLQAGDRVTMESPGGGGMYQPSERDAQALARDIKEGLVSPDAAAAAYGRAPGDVPVIQDCA